MNAGDILSLGTQGGGGYGDPLKRPAEKVFDDVVDGYLTLETARRDYGVVASLKNGVDEIMTRALRDEIRAERGPLNFYEFGKARDAYQALWSDELHDAICDTISGLPNLQRQISFRALYTEISARFEDNLNVKPEDVPSIHSEILSRAAHLRRIESG